MSHRKRHFRVELLVASCYSIEVGMAHVMLHCEYFSLQIQYNITYMAWLLDGGLVLMQMVKYYRQMFNIRG